MFLYYFSSSVSEPIDDDLSKFGELLSVRRPSVTNVCDEIVLEKSFVTKREENTSIEASTEFSREKICAIADINIKDSANINEHSGHDNEGGLLANGNSFLFYLYCKFFQIY